MAEQSIKVVHKGLLLFSFLFLSFQGFGQIYGTITDALSGEALPYASVYVKGTSEGTSGNVEGHYELDLEPGKYTIVFQYIGYKTEEYDVQLGTEPVALNASLARQDITLDEVVVKANGEDPAYRIIRKAIEKRKYYRDQLTAFSCRSYVKGVIEFLEAPKEFMGTDLGDMGGILDSTRQGILYLSESESNYHFQEPNQVKEVMISSLVSGDDNGFSFNRGSEMDFSFYDNYIDFARPILSPIGSGAMGYYEYKLDGVYYDDNGRLINKIEVIPKRETEPLYFGYIYIVEDLWNIHSAELSLTGAALKQPIIDTFTIKQIQVPVAEPDVWRIFTQQISFTFGLFGFKVGGNFTAVFSDYELDPDFEDGFFDKEVLTVQEGANERDSSYWAEIRPIPLTREEIKDYHRKDSLQEIWDSKEYKDSLDRESNKFNYMNVLLGYTYQNRYDGWRIEIPSPLDNYYFNPVQGSTFGLAALYHREINEERNEWIGFGPRILYGFADDDIRWELNLEYRRRGLENTEIDFSFGQNVTQFNREHPVPVFLNSSYALYGKRNYVKLYENRYQRLEWRQSLLNGVDINLEIERSRRLPLFNNSTFSFFKRDDRSYDANNPLDADAYDESSFISHRAITANLALSYQPGQKYIRYPNRKFSLGSNWPVFHLAFRTAQPIGEAKVDFDFIRAGIRKGDIGFGLVGKMHVFVEGGDFLSSEFVPFMDYQHFAANRMHVSTEDLTGQFLAMPYYTYSTQNGYAQAHVEHEFNGFILDKLPLIRKLGFTSIFKAGVLWSEEHPRYAEIGFGIDKIGIGAFRVLRLDFVWAHRGSSFDDFHMVIGLSL